MNGFLGDINPMIVSNIINTLKNTLSGGSEGQTFFRRFDKLTHTSKILSIRKYSEPHVYTTLNSLENVSREDQERYIEVTYQSFTGKTDYRSIRFEPRPLKDLTVEFKSDNYCDLNVNTFEFEKTSRSVPTPFNNGKAGELIYCFMSNETLNNIRYSNSGSVSADKWCIVSEQFLHMWTCITCGWNKAFDRMIAKNLVLPVEKELALRDKLFSGNILMTNTWLKHKLSTLQSGAEWTQTSSESKFWHLRTEEASKSYVDVYTAIVSIARYGVFPTRRNVPNNKGCAKNETLYLRKEWNIPEMFISSHFPIGFHFPIEPEVEAIIPIISSTTVEVPTPIKTIVLELNMNDLEPPKIIKEDVKPFRFFEIACNIDWY